jgi:hypothetical protein
MILRIYFSLNACYSNAQHCTIHVFKEMHLQRNYKQNLRSNPIFDTCNFHFLLNI